MASYYVHSGAAGAGTGANWANAYTTIVAAMTGKTAGDVFYVAHDHAETSGAALTIPATGTDAAPCRIYCVDRAGSVPPVSADLRTTATVTTTGANNISIQGTLSECYGIIFTTGNSITVGSFANRACRLRNCALRLGNATFNTRINLGAGSATMVVLENTTIQFGGVDQFLVPQGRAIWKNTPSAITGAILPTTLITQAVQGASLFIEGVDLSALGSGNTIMGVANNLTDLVFLKDCKLGASVTVSATPTGLSFQENFLIRSDSGDTNYRTEKYTYTGTQTTETTIVRTDGASDGTTPIAWKIVTTANSEWEFPFECLPITVWNETTGSAITVTVEGIWGGGAVPTNDDIFIDVEYLGTSGFPLASRASSTKADGLATGTAIPAGSGTWGGSTTKFAMSATFTPQEKGPLTIYVRAAKASSTFYVDPKPVVT